MKLFNLSLIVAVLGQGQNDERKIPPRTPDQRMTFLNKKLQEWITYNFADKRPTRTPNLSDNVQTQVVDKLAFAFGDRKCAKWSKEWPNGGPDPNGPRGNVLWKDYRKQLVTRLDARVAEKAAKKEAQESARKRREVNTRARRSLEMLESINEDVFDIYFNNAAKDGERSAGIELERMLSSDQKVRLYQILVSYMKWAFRYMAECPNDAAGTHAVKMYDFIENQLVELYDLIQQRIEEKNQ